METSDDHDGCEPTEKKCFERSLASTSDDSQSLLDMLLAARSHTKIEKVTLNAVKLTAIFSKRRKIGAS